MAEQEQPLVSKSESFKKEQHICLNIGNPTDIEGGLEEPPLVQPLETPTAAEVEAQLERELQDLKARQATANGPKQ
eukprot:jgi/Chrzof1/8679/Cz03g20080.t1